MTAIRTSILAALAAVGALACPVTAVGSQTYVYAVSHSRFGAIGTYERTIDDSGGITRDRSVLKITVRIWGLVVHRERMDQTENWKDGRLISFQSTTEANGRQIVVSGEARAGRFFITSPSGTRETSADIVAADPWALVRIGRAEVVSIKSGRIDQVEVTGGEEDHVMVGGVSTPVRHFRASTAAQTDRWDVWIDAQGAPIKFRSIEHGDAVDFTLVSSSSP